MDIVIWTRARWAGPSPSLILFNIELRLYFNTLNTLNLTLNLALAAALPPLYKPPPSLRRKIVSGCGGDELNVHRWTRARWAGPSPSLILFNIELRLYFNTLNTLNLTLNLALAAALPPLYKPPPSLRRKIVSGQFDEENPFVQISSVLLVQADEGVSFLVVDRIGDFYRNLPYNGIQTSTLVNNMIEREIADFLVERRHFATQSMRVIRFPDVNASQLSCSLQLVLREKLATGFDDVSYATSFELVETQRFNATSGCPVFGI
ncbi:hypothetical protein F511_35002 [Dorcoceras hygrometricum]|uniref:Uncharacterized protein n=1 Tax=Dorcoceras hygrometricum TaxID=472368 RepID=A0A2Z7DCI4_9LAMI|nr:hypothetical protein F511_35002 [Dorcoceras hygrometricum]